MVFGSFSRFFRESSETVRALPTERPSASTRIQHHESQGEMRWLKICAEKQRCPVVFNAIREASGAETGAV